MNGVVLLVGGLLLVAVIKLIIDRNWIGLLLCAVALLLVFGAGHHGEDAAVDRYDDTHFTAKIEVNPSGTFYGWIFKFKGKIKILSPKECITEMQQIAQEFI